MNTPLVSSSASSNSIGYIPTTESTTNPRTIPRDVDTKTNTYRKADNVANKTDITSAQNIVLPAPVNPASQELADSIAGYFEQHGDELSAETRDQVTTLLAKQFNIGEDVFGTQSSGADVPDPADSPVDGKPDGLFGVPKMSLARQAMIDSILLGIEMFKTDLIQENTRTGMGWDAAHANATELHHQGQLARTAAISGGAVGLVASGAGTVTSIHGGGKTLQGQHHRDVRRDYDRANPAAIGLPGHADFDIPMALPDAMAIQKSGQRSQAIGDFLNRGLGTASNSMVTGAINASVSDAQAKGVEDNAAATVANSITQASTQQKNSDEAFFNAVLARLFEWTKEQAGTKDALRV